MKLFNRRRLLSENENASVCPCGNLQIATLKFAKICHKKCQNLPTKLPNLQKFAKKFAVRIHTDNCCLPHETELLKQTGLFGVLLKIHKFFYKKNIKKLYIHHLEYICFGFVEVLTYSPIDTTGCERSLERRETNLADLQVPDVKFDFENGPKKENISEKI